MRRRSFFILAVALAATLAAGCADPLATPSGAAPLRYRDEVFSAVTMTSDVTYGTAVNQQGATVTLKIDIYRPTGDVATNRPAVIWIHGGGFSGGDKTSPEIVDEANTLAKKGYVSASISYRLNPGGCSAAGPTAGCIIAIQQATFDGQTAVRFLRDNATTYGIDPTRIAAGGSSAGAITALNVGYNGDNPGPGDHQGFSSSIRAAQSISGAALGTGSISPGDAAALLFHGSADPIVPYVWAQNTVTEATADHLVAVLRTWPGEGHVPYLAHRAQILSETANFFYSQMDLAHAAT